jgi:hypothetical protein
MLGVDADINVPAIDTAGTNVPVMETLYKFKCFKAIPMLLGNVTDESFFPDTE